MLPIKRLEEFKHLLSSDLLAHQLNEKDTISSTLVTIYDTIQAMDAESQRRFLISSMDTLLTRLATEEILHAQPDQLINEQILIYAITGFISSLIKEQDDVKLHQNHKKIESYIQENNIYFNSTNAIAYQLAQLSFEPDIFNDYDPIFKNLMKKFKLKADILGLDPFQVRRSEKGKKVKYQNYYEMLKALELTGGKININDDEHKTDVPHRDHFIWNGSVVPSQYYENIKSWKRYNPDHNVVIYTDSTDERDDFLVFKKWCFDNNILLVDINDCLRFHKYYDLFRDATYAKEMYGSVNNNHGAGSDISRYILLSLYRGLYADIPDVRCTKSLPQRYSDNVFISKIRNYKSNKLFPNEFLVCGHEETKTGFEILLDKIANKTATGWPSFKEDIVSKNGITFDPYTQNYINDMAITSLRTGNLQNGFTRKASNNKQEFSLFSGKSEAEINLYDYVNRSKAGSWVSQNKAPVIHKDYTEDELEKLIGAALTGLLRDLRYYPYIINFDKYPVFTNPKAFKIALDFLSVYFPNQLNKVKNIIAYTTSPKIILPHLKNFGNLTPSSFLSALSKTQPDPQYLDNYKDYTLAFIDEVPGIVEKLFAANDNIFANACKAGNFELALTLIDKLHDDEIFVAEIDELPAYETIFLMSDPDYSRAGPDLRIEIFKKMHEKGYTPPEDAITDYLQESIANGEFEAAVYFFNQLEEVSQIEFLMTIAPTMSNTFHGYVEALKAAQPTLSTQDINNKALEDFHALFKIILKNHWDYLTTDIQQMFLELIPQLNFQQSFSAK